MSHFTMFHFYLIFFLLGLGYATVAVVMGQLAGGHEGGHEAGGHGLGGHDAGGHEVGGHGLGGHDAGGHALGGHGAGHDAGGHESADHGDTGHGHGLADLDMGDAMPNISPLSPVTIATFATSFGGVGLVLSKIGMPSIVSFPVAGGSGFVIASGVFYLFYRVFSITQSTSGVSIRHAIGRHADVITAIPAGGVGEIAYVLGGRRFNAPARAEGNLHVPVGKSVVISRITGGRYYVKELDAHVTQKADPQNRQTSQ